MRNLSHKKITEKIFTRGLNSLFEDLIEKPKKGRPRTTNRVITKSSQEDTKEKETRATFLVNEELLDKLKAIAYWDRLLIKDVVDRALQDVVTKYERKNGNIKPIPTE
ncbi:hypothetical protein SAMN06298216_2987 [Spirosomataceae bacterium TFI 002]|nr:hypothetical protein SAMN06298216_2987 [Spirosomataceae bacterium TFI 002]